MFLGAAVGILVTMVLAAGSAIVLVLVRNTRQKNRLSEMAHYNSLNTGSRSSIQSSLTTKHSREFGQPDLVRVETNYNKNRDSNELYENAVRNQGKDIVDQEQKGKNYLCLTMKCIREAFQTKAGKLWIGSK